MATRVILPLPLALLAACTAWNPPAEAIWPFPDATAVDADTTILIEHEYATDADPYGIERVYRLEGPSGDVPYSAELLDAWTLAIKPDARLDEGVYQIDVREGTDSNAFTSTYNTPYNLGQPWMFSTASTPTPVCQTWYESGWQGAASTWAQGRLLCLHFSEPLVPGGVDLALGQVWINGEALKASGLTPASFPELLCVVTPDALEPTDWEIALRPDDVVAQAGGSFGEEVTVAAGDLLNCHDLPFVLPRWRPEEDAG